MSLSNTKSSYGIITKTLHWITALLVLALIAVGYMMESMPPSEQKWDLYAKHKATGVVLLSIILIRIIWRVINVRVQLPQDVPKWQKLAAHANHYILYFLLLLMPSSGILMSLLGGHDINMYGLFTIKSFEVNKELATIFHSTHVFTAIIISSFIALHFLAAMYHHFIRKDGVLMRMIK